MPVPVSNDEDEALAEFARELAKRTGISNDVSEIVSNIRWYANSAGAVVIVKRGKDRKVLATISPKSGKWSHLYPTWKPILARLDAEKKAANVSRMSHDGFELGKVPESRKE